MEAAGVLSAQEIRKAIEDRGFFYAKDAAMGRNIEGMEKDKIPFASAGGLKFCKVNVLDNSVSIYHSSTRRLLITAVHSACP